MKTRFRNLYAVDISPDNRRIVVASKGDISIVSTQTGQVLRRHALGTAGSTIHAANFSPDGVHAVLGFKDKTASVVDTRTGEETLHFAGPSTRSRRLGFCSTRSFETPFGFKMICDAFAAPRGVFFVF